MASWIHIKNIINENILEQRETFNVRKIKLDNGLTLNERTYIKTLLVSLLRHTLMVSKHIHILELGRYFS